MSRKLELPLLTRTFAIEEFVGVTRGDSAEVVATYAASISSEAPVRRWFGTEILSHEKSAVDTSRLVRGLTVLDSHDPTRILGVLEGAELDVEKKRIRGRIRFSRSAAGQEAELDVKDGIRKFLSVGYRIDKAKLIESSKEKGDTWLATRWTPAEVSLLAVPADISVGIGRGASGDEDRLYPVEVETLEQEEQRSMERESTTPAAGAAPATTAPPATPAAGTAPAIDVGRTLEERNLEVEQIFGLAELNGIPGPTVRSWIGRGLSLGDVSREILKTRATTGSSTPAAEVIAPKDVRKYSYLRALQLLYKRAMGLGAKFDGVEAEVDAEIRRQLPANFVEHGGLFVPMQLRTLTSQASGGATELVHEQPGEMIELLRKKAVLTRLGARLLTGLSGPVAFPKQSGAATVYWRGENPGSSTTASQPTTAQVLVQPKTLAGRIPFSRQLLVQASIDVENWVREELSIGHALAFDLAGLHGLSSESQPTGIYNAADVLSVAFGGAPTYPKVVEMSGKVADQNADLGSLGYVATPLLASVMKVTPRHATAAVNFIWEGTYENGEIDGYRAMASSQVSKTLGAGAEHGMIFGNWADLILAMFGAMELIVDPYSLKNEQLVEVASFQMGDVVIRHPESFCKATGATLS